jgi:A/G-specific adenine glycosylase
LPDDPEQLRRLPGIGPYTVAALSSIAFHRDAAALDTNVRRVVGRLVFGYPAPDAAIARAAAELLPPGRSADWNQALMDFGSLQCTSARPACQICPLADVCAAAPVSDKRSVDRRVAESPEPYLGSRRFYRGRVVAVLRDLKSDETIPLAGLLALLKDEPAADDEAWLRGLVANLARDGLARIIDDAGSVRVGPPQ